MFSVNPLKLAPLCVFLAALLADGVCSGQPFILHLDGIQGDFAGIESPGTLYANDIEVNGYSWEVDRAADTNGLPGVTNNGSLIVTKELDVSSPYLSASNANATVFSSAVLHVMKNNDLTETEPETVTLTRVVLNLFSQNATGPGRPLETLGLNYQSISCATGPNGPNPAASGCLYLLSPAGSNAPSPLVTDFADAVHQASSPAAWIGVQDLSFGMQGTTNHSVDELSQPKFPDLYFHHTITPHSENFLKALLAGVIYTNAVIDLLAYQPSNSSPVWYHLKIGRAWISGVADSRGGQMIRMHVLGPVSWSYSLRPDGTGENDTFTGSSANKKTSAFATATSVASSPPMVTLTWPAVDGATYQIVEASQPQGPFSPVTLVTATNTGAMSYSITNSGPFQFYQVRLPFPNQ